MNIDLEHINQYCYIVKSFYLPDILDRKYLVIDCEATGFNHRTEDITEIAVMPLVNRRRQLEHPWSSFVKTTKKIPSKIKRLTGITNKDLLEGMSLKAALSELTDKYSDFVWIAQCGFEFDFPILQKAYYRLFKRDLPFPVLDTKLLYQYLYPEISETISTDYLLEKYSIGKSDITRHRAAGDVILITKILKNILQEYKLKHINNISIDKTITIKKFIPK